MRVLLSAKLSQNIDSCSMRCLALQVLYVSDHIYSDLNMSKKWVGWRTMLVVPELQTELVLQRKHSQVQARLSKMVFSITACKHQGTHRSAKNQTGQIAAKSIPRQVCVMLERSSNQSDIMDLGFCPSLCLGGKLLMHGAFPRLNNMDVSPEGWCLFCSMS